uniref:F-box protein At5g07610-like n=1 Tax=Erigeron canadensis TaxID=72917 RepID=UPI001CB918D9|nr:F-box protein At5g07610-like [Erigeron canadensis]XP_043607046.1 F-box protein At5g07610-like [Erigeron canadensis]XP_043607047.1 F-box protein At5g07610-like [Erigeron canadensis]
MKSTAGSYPVSLAVVIGDKGASKKQMRDAKKEDNQLPSSVREVLSNNDLLMEVLLRLPLISIHLFKSVSRGWLSIITDPHFSVRRSQNLNIDPPTGLLIRKPQSFIRYEFVPLDTRIPAKKSPLPFTFPFGSNVEILQSCNGLLLCCDKTKGNTFYVYNPSFNRFRRLPQVHSNRVNRFSLFDSMKLAFDPVKSFHYKAVYAEDIHTRFGSSYIQIQTYSSKTGVWRVCEEQFPLHSFIGFYRGTYWNDAIHWLDTANGASHFKLDIQDLLLTKIQTPVAMDNEVHYDHKLFVSSGHLIFICMVSARCRQLNVYDMMNGNSGWSLKYVVNLDDVMMLFPTSWILSGDKQFFCVRCVMLGNREEDPLIVMEVFGKVIEYKIMLNTVRKIDDLGSTSTGSSAMKPSNFDSFEFIASFAGV